MGALLKMNLKELHARGSQAAEELDSVDPNQQELYRLTCVVQLVVEFDDDNDIVISEDADATNEREAEA